jgi:DNA-binding winged helix-turn-helix (wHTH) protein/tetratricopeptide (TPR) repeat protein
MPDAGFFEFGPFRLDADKSVLWRAGEVVPATPKALGVLTALLRKGGDVVSKEELLAEVWARTVVEEANVNVTVAALRKVLGERPEGGSYIQTVPRRGYRFDSPVRASGGSSSLALAVLPFAGIGPGIEDHVGLGLADALIARLSEIEAIHVRPTLAIAQYEMNPRGPREAARDLGVDAVVTGTLQREGTRVRVSVQLVPRPEDLRPWAASFDAEWTDLFTVQDTLAERVANALSLRLNPRTAEAHYTPGAPAFEAYLRGRYFWARFDPENLGKAFAYFGEAAKMDPRYGAPQAGLAAAHLLLGLGGLQPPREAWNVTEECAERALALDPSLPEAHVSRAYARLFRDWDWDGARVAFERALRIAPGNASIHLWHGLFLVLAGDLPRARKAIQRGRNIDPLSALTASLRCVAHELAGEFEEEVEVARQAVELRPNRIFGYWNLGVASVFLGDAEGGIAALRRAVALSANGPAMRALLAWALVRGGRAQEGAALLAELDASASSTFVSPCQRATVLGALGDLPAGLRRIEEGVEQRDPWVLFMDADPRYAPFRNEPAFTAIVEKVRSAGG